MESFFKNSPLISLSIFRKLKKKRSDFHGKKHINKNLDREHIGKFFYSHKSGIHDRCIQTVDGACLETQISEDGGQTFHHTELSPMDFRKIAPIKFDDDDNDGEVPEVPINHVYQERRTEGPPGVYTAFQKYLPDILCME